MAPRTVLLREKRIEHKVMPNHNVQDNVDSSVLLIIKRSPSAVAE